MVLITICKTHNYWQIKLLETKIWLTLFLLLIYKSLFTIIIELGLIYSKQNDATKEIIK